MKTVCTSGAREDLPPGFDYDTRPSTFCAPGGVYQSLEDGTIPYLMRGSPLGGGAGYLDYDDQSGYVEAHLIPRTGAPTKRSVVPNGHNPSVTAIGQYVVAHTPYRPWPNLSASANEGYAWAAVPAPPTGGSPYPDTGSNATGSFDGVAYAFGHGVLDGTTGQYLEPPAVTSVEVVGGQAVSTVRYLNESDFWPDGAQTYNTFLDRYVWPQVESDEERGTFDVLPSVSGVPRLFFLNVNTSGLEIGGQAVGLFVSTSSTDPAKKIARPKPVRPVPSSAGAGAYADFNGSLYYVGTTSILRLIPVAGVLPSQWTWETVTTAVDFPLTPDYAAFSETGDLAVAGLIPGSGEPHTRFAVASIPRESMCTIVSCPSF